VRLDIEVLSGTKSPDHGAGHGCGGIGVRVRCSFVRATTICQPLTRAGPNP
jgi:hypothetical protein